MNTSQSIGMTKILFHFFLFRFFSFRIAFFSLLLLLSSFFSVFAVPTRCFYRLSYLFVFLLLVGCVSGWSIGRSVCIQLLFSPVQMISETVNGQYSNRFLSFSLLFTATTTITNANCCNIQAFLLSY